MALPVTDQLITQMMKENVRTQPTTPMEGNVSRPMIVSDLLSAMKDVNFNQLLEQYGNMAGVASQEDKPLTRGLMKEESTKVPDTPLKKEKVTTQQQTEEPIQVPTPMKDAMAMNTLSPVDSIEQPEQPIEENTGLMSNIPQQIA
tara:strand:+ start:715 stop:1149 length:435 start_codon:yes stop_codon:yes gene_type:complete